MGQPVRAVYEDRLESPVPRRLSLCPGSATRTFLVLFAQGRNGIFRVAQWADVYSLSRGGKFAFRDSHRFGRQSDNWQVPVSVSNSSNDGSPSPRGRGQG